MIDLNGKVAIVTGGGSGIGKGISLVLANQGASVVIADVNIENASSVVSELESKGKKGIAISTDVSDKESIESMVNQVISEFGQIDILVNNAGVMGAPDWDGKRTPTDEDWDWALSINLMGVVNVSEAVSPFMKERRYGKIVNVASTAARVAIAQGAQYSASKAATLNFTQSNALQLAPHNINVNCICPGNVWTPMSQKPDIRPKLTFEEFEKTVSSSNPMGRSQTLQDMGNLTAFLVSDDSCNITGQAINIDGGQLLN